jgi:tRNA C32,U32 (ribose-2'-O)-methylase TrmJ
MLQNAGILSSIEEAIRDLDAMVAIARRMRALVEIWACEILIVFCRVRLVARLHQLSA